MSCPGFSDDMMMNVIGNNDQKSRAATANPFPKPIASRLVRKVSDLLAQ